MAASRMSFSWAGGVAALGKQLTVSIARDNQSYRHHLVVQFGGVAVRDIWGVTNTAVFTLDYNLAQYARGNPWGTLNIICYTYNGAAQAGNLGSYVGSTSLSATVTIPDDVKPTLTDFTLSDPNGYLTTYGVYVAGQSELKAAINASGTYGATIKSYKLSIGTTWNIFDAPELSISPRNFTITGTINVTVTVTDSRGYYTQKTKQITVVPYSAPSLSGSNVKRWNTSTSQEDDESNTVRVNVVGSITNVNNKNVNTGTAKIEVASYGSDSWTVKDTRSVGTSSFNYNCDISGLDKNNRYQARITVTDSFGSETSSVLVIDTATPVIDFKSDGKGISFFGVSSKDGFEVNSDSYFNGVSTYNNVVQLNDRTTGIWHQELGGDAATWHEIARSEKSVSDTGCSGEIRIYGSLGGYGVDSRGYFDIVIIPRGFDSSLNVIVLQKTSFNHQLCNLEIYKDRSGFLHVYILRYAKQYYTYHVFVQGFQCSCPNTISTTSPTSLDMDLCGDLTAYSTSIFPVGTVLIRYDDISPASLYGGAWERIQGRFLYATGYGGTIGATGGSGTHTLTVNEMPSHQHYYSTYNTLAEASGYGLTMASGFANRVMVNTDSGKGWSTGWAGGGQAHNNNPAFVNVAVWRRTI